MNADPIDALAGMTYAAAKVGRLRLLAVGDDFPQTDLEFHGVVGFWPESNPRN